MDGNKPRLVELNQKAADGAEAKRVADARRLAAAVEESKARRPMLLELMSYQCQDWFDRYQALQKAGFTATEALQLCWRQS